MKSLKKIISIEDILNWSYCPQSYLLAKQEKDRNTVLSGETLYKDILQKSIYILLEAKEKFTGKIDPKMLDSIPMKLWDGYLTSHNLMDLKPALEKYRILKNKLVNEFRMRDRNYAFFQDPRILNKWDLRFEESGLSDLLIGIESVAYEHGILAKPLRKPNIYFSPMGLGEAYERSFDTFRLIFDQVDLMQPHVLVNEPVIIQGLQYDFSIHIDLAINIGKIIMPPTKKVGRPNKSSKPETPKTIYAVRYIYFSFDQEIPLPNELMQNIRFRSLYSSKIPSRNIEFEYLPMEIQVLHIASGRSHIMKFDAEFDSEFLVELNQLGRAFQQGVNIGTVLSRKLTGSELCKTCEFYGKCYSAENKTISDVVLPHVIKKQPEIIEYIKFLLGKSDQNDIYLNEALILQIVDLFRKYPSIDIYELPNYIDFIKKSNRGEGYLE